MNLNFKKKMSFMIVTIIIYNKINKNNKKSNKISNYK